MGAVIFYETLSLSTTLFLSDFAHYQVPLPTGEGNLVGSSHYLDPYLIPLSTTIGGLLSALLVFSIAPEAEGHGTDAAIRASHKRPWGVRVRVVLVKIVASALTIGSGGSGGREGPTGQISAGFGSLVARTLRLSTRDSQMAVAVGIGSGIGAIFGAPLGGAILAGEILYTSDIDAVVILPALLASTVAYSIFGAAVGYTPIFGFVTTSQSVSTKYLWIFALAGIVYAGLGVLYSKVFYTTVSLTHKVPLPRFVKPAIGGFLVGVIALFAPQVLGTGYGWIQLTFTNALETTPLILVIAIPFLRIIATSLSIGTGGSGGIFGPGMVIGAFSGYGLWRVLEPILPRQLSHDPAIFVIGAMAATFGSVARAPIAITIMVFEMTGNFSTVESTAVSLVTATLVVALLKGKIYKEQLSNRLVSIPTRLDSLIASPVRLDSLERELCQIPTCVKDEYGRPPGEALSAKAPSSSAANKHALPKPQRTVSLPNTADLREVILAKYLLQLDHIQLVDHANRRYISYKDVIRSWVRQHLDSFPQLLIDGELQEYPIESDVVNDPYAALTVMALPLAIKEHESGKYRPFEGRVKKDDTIVYLDLDRRD